MATVVGMIQQDAENELLRQGYTVRIAEVDGQSFAMTAEFRLDRINLIVEGGVVVRAYVG